MLYEFSVSSRGTSKVVNAEACGLFYILAARPMQVSVMRIRVEPRDVPREAAARRLGLRPAEFDACFDNLIARGFPAPDPDTGNFNSYAIDRWCDARYPHLFGGTAVMRALDASSVAPRRIAAMRGGQS